MHNVWIVFLLAALATALAQDTVSSSNPCSAFKTCGDCITGNPSCAWCTQDGFEGQGSRCDTLNNLKSKECSDEFITNPSTKFMVDKADPLSSGSVGVQDEAVQVYPQEVTLTVRPHKPYTMTMEYRQAMDYPVDLYYLMDLSNSMEDDKSQLAALGDILAAKMQSITKNFRLGFGSFVDKTVMPYVSTVPAKLNAPCDGCAAPYSFKHHLDLTTNTKLFSAKVTETPVSGNLDSPEGGMDALMQAIVCEDAIGWRKVARHLVIFSTDASFHYAGDGKLGGIVKPNDGVCHMRNNEYTMATELDYPSISQLIRVVKEKSINLIFAVTENTFGVYDELSALIHGSTAGVLANDSSNIVDLVQENYDKIRSEVLLSDNATEGITVKYHSSCLGNEVEETNKCMGMKVGDTVTFNVTITVDSCPENGEQTLVIKPVNINEELRIRLRVECECDCESSGVLDSPRCNGTGTYECGICDCLPGFKGRQCECDAKQYTGDASEDSCKLNPNDTSAQTCFGRGECVCGVCECYEREKPGERVWGEVCQCDNFSCGNYKLAICGGTGRGECDCGKCVCKPEYKGDRCQCPSSEQSCMADNGLICAGHGKCDCGRCLCDADSLYRGPLCEDCPTCAGQCEDNRDCVQCVMWGTGVYDTKELCDANCANKTIIPEDEVYEDAEAGVRKCQFKDTDGCTFYFTYEYNKTIDTQPESDVVIIRAQKTKHCPPPVPLAAIIAGVVGGIVAVGLALLIIWKLLTMIHDRREFAKFEKERQNAKWDTGENPIYKQATSTFKNPTYGGQ